MSKSSWLGAKVNAEKAATTTMTTLSTGWSTFGDISDVTDSVTDDYVCRTALYFEIPGTK